MVYLCLYEQKWHFLTPSTNSLHQRLNSLIALSVFPIRYKTDSDQASEHLRPESMLSDNLS